MPMTSRQRLQAALDAQPVDHAPWSPFLAYVWENFPASIQAMGQPAFLKAVGADPLWRGAPCPVKAISDPRIQYHDQVNGDHGTTTITTPVGALRQTRLTSRQGNTTFLMEHPLKTAEDFKVQTWIEEHTRLEYNETPVEEHFRGAGAEGLSLGMLIPRCKSAFQSLVEHHVGTEELAYALCDFPDTVETLWKTMVARDLEAVALAARCEHYQHWITWEDSSTQNYSPTQYETYIGSEIAQWCRILAPHGQRYYQHACGHVRDIVGIMARDGMAGIESVSPKPTGNIAIRDVRKIIGPRCAIIGGIEPTHFLHLPLSELSGYVEGVIEELSGGPFILANSDSCPPGVTMEKFVRVGEVARSYRLTAAIENRKSKIENP